MATFEMMKKSLETLEKNVKVSKSLLGAKVDSLDEMKRNRQEAENDEDRRELKIAIESLETIVDKDRVAVADLEASYKELKEEVDKAEAATKLQAIKRGQQARKVSEEKKISQMREEREKAAVKTACD